MGPALHSDIFVDKIFLFNFKKYAISYSGINVNISIYVYTRLKSTNSNPAKNVTQFLH